ncbi:MAG: acyl carrier protein [Paludibacteraceae bacterium]|jgi:acyl carrier protein|nr:acyl carrier protein [Paludibacteraceae bacterium]
MNKERLILRVREILAEEFEKDINDLTPDANVKATLELDSLSLVDMVALIEAEFKVKVTGTEVAQIKTFAELYDFIEERLK